jgi:hypothetical protein
LEQDPRWIEQELAGIVSTLRPEQGPVEIPPERAHHHGAEAVLTKEGYAFVAVIAALAALYIGSFWLNDWQPVAHWYPGYWWTLGGVVAVLTRMGSCRNMDFGR